MSLQSSKQLVNLLNHFKDRNIEGLVLRVTKVSGSFSYWVEITDDAVRQEIEGDARYKMHVHGGSKVVKLNSA